MLKKVLIGLGVFAAVFVAFILFFFFYWTRLGSPMQEVHYESPEMSVDIFYCSPSKKGRLIFGSESEDALISYGKYWRLGANQSTEIEFSTDVVFGDEDIKAGKYRMYAIPGADFWKIRLNSELGVWGAGEPNYTLDVAEITALVQSDLETEKFTISIDDSNEDLNIKLNWDKAMVEIPLQSM